MLLILQYPQRMDELCSRIEIIQIIRDISLLQYPQRMDELCSAALPVLCQTAYPLAVSSADG